MTFQGEEGLDAGGVQKVQWRVCVCVCCVCEHFDLHVHVNNNKQINLGNLIPTRDFTYVIDTCSAFLEVLSNKKFFGEITNVGTNSEISVKSLAYKIIKLMNSNKEIKEDSIRLRPKKSEVERLVCSNKKLITYSNWKPQFDIDQGLQLTIDWFKENNSQLKPNIFNV